MVSPLETPSFFIKGGTLVVQGYTLSPLLSTLLSTLLLYTLDTKVVLSN